MTSCPACGARDQLAQVPKRPLDSAVDYRTISCTACGLWFSDPMRHPGAAWYAASEIYAGRESRPTVGTHRPFRLDWRHGHVASLLIRHGVSLLDVGCGDGGFLAWAQERGCDVYGVDIDPRAVELAGQRIGPERVSVASAEECAADGAGRRFDIICLFDVLEHLVDPVAVLRGLALRLAPSGALFCAVPSHERWPKWFAPGVDSPPHHLTLWSGAALRAAAGRAGLSASIERSPLVPEHIVDQLAARVPLLRAPGVVLRAALAVVALCLAPTAARVLRAVRPDAGGFALCAIARPPYR